LVLRVFGWKTVINYISSHFEISDLSSFKRLRDVACVIIGFEHILFGFVLWLARKTVFERWCEAAT
jgi:hypothetical protein